MPETGLHFAQPLWLLGLLVIPGVLFWLWKSAPVRRAGQESRYADAHLMPYLSGAATMRMVHSRRALLAWALVWGLLSLAMAGPRWGYHQINPFEPGADLVVLLDISRSMGVRDVRPSRLERARQEIQDLVQSGTGVRIGLVAFATIAHVVTPITEDSDSLLRQ
jgi:Ca-activated chloride channel family protein